MNKKTQPESDEARPEPQSGEADTRCCQMSRRIKNDPITKLVWIIFKWAIIILGMLYSIARGDYKFTLIILSIFSCLHFMQSELDDLTAKLKQNIAELELKIKNNNKKLNKIRRNF